MSHSESVISLGEDYELTDKNDDSFVFTLDRKSGVLRKQAKYTEEYTIEEISQGLPLKNLTNKL